MKEFRRLYAYTKGVRGRLFAGLLLRAAELTGQTFLLAELVRRAVELAEGGMPEEVLRTAAAFFPPVLAVMALHFAGVLLTEQAALEGAAALRREIMEKILAADLRALQEEKSEILLAAFGKDIQAAFTNLVQLLQVPANGLLLGLGGILFLAAAHFGLALLVAGVILWQMFYSVRIAGKMRRISGRLLEARSQTCLWMQSLLDGAESVRMDGMQEVVEKGFTDACMREKKEAVRYGSLSGLIGGLNNGNGQILDNGSVFLAGLLAVSGRLGIGQVVEVSQLSGRVAQVLNLSRILTDTQMSVTGTARIFGLTDRLRPEKTGRKKSGEKEPSLEMEQASFSYQEGNTVWEDADFRLEKGTVTALMGESGTGKSTLFRLAEGLYLPRSGRIFVKGVDTADWDRPALRRLIAFVPQQPVVLPGTVAENIMMGCEKKDWDRMKEAVRKAGAEEAVLRLPEGYNACLTGRQGCFSGGELQRLSLARAIYRQAEILLLDEPTSALDAENEQRFYDFLKEYKKERVVLVSTHRPGILKIADQVLTIRNRKLELFKI